MKERLHPGRIFLVDTAQGAHHRRRGDQGPARRRASVRRLAPGATSSTSKTSPAHPVPAPDHATVLTRQIAFGYTHEDLRILLAPMAKNGEEPVGSMGTDTAAGGALESPASALRLLQAALRAGDQSAARPDPRGAGDVDGVDGRARAAISSSPSRSPAARSSSRTRSSPTRSSRSSRHVDDRGFKARHLAHAVSGGRGRGRPRAGARAAPAPRQRGDRRRLQHHHPVGPRRRTRRRPSRASSPPRRCTTTWCGAASARAAGS